MAENIFSIDQSKSMGEQDVPGHNRWHPDIPAVASVDPGTDFRMDCREWTDGQIKNTDDASDVRDIDATRLHVLSGPVHINGAEPGDLLVVDILDMGPHIPHTAPDDLAGAGWGFTGIFARENGGGFLTDVFPEAYKAIFDFHVSTPPPGTYLASGSRAYTTRACSAALLPTKCCPGGTAGSKRSSTPTLTGCRR